MSISVSVYSKQKSCKTCYKTCLGRLHGNMLRYSSHSGDEGFVFTPKGNYRKNLWNSKRKPWIPIYTNVRKSADENESRAHFCVHEFKEACKM